MDDRTPTRTRPLGAVQPQVGLRAATVRKFRMIGGHATAEDALHAPDQLRRRAISSGSTSPPRASVSAIRCNFGLSRPRHGCQQRRRLFGELLPQRTERFALRRGQFGQPDTPSRPARRCVRAPCRRYALALQRMQHGTACRRRATSPVEIRVRPRRQEYAIPAGFRTAWARAVRASRRPVQAPFVVQLPRQRHVTLRAGRNSFGELPRYRPKASSATAAPHASPRPPNSHSTRRSTPRAPFAAPRAGASYSTRCMDLIVLNGGRRSRTRQTTPV